MDSVKWIGFDLTCRCNAKCDHCWGTCGPDRTEEVHLDNVLKWIDQVGPMRQISWIAFSGGEPFLYKGLDDVVKRAKKYGKRVRLFTNGFWATSLESAKKRLIELGPAEVVVSSDEFHEKYVKLENVKNVIRACRALKIRHMVNGRGEYARARAELEREFKKLDFADSPWISPLGRALDNRVAAQYLIEPDTPEAVCIHGCDLNRRVIHVDVDGVVHFCCGIPEIAAKDGPFVVGNANEADLRSIIESIDPVLSIPQRGNLCALIAAVRAAGLGCRLKKEYSTGCNVCIHMMSDPEMKHAITDFYDKPGPRIYPYSVMLPTGKAITLHIRETDFSKVAKKGRLHPLPLLNAVLADNLKFGSRAEPDKRVFPIALLGNSVYKMLDIAFGSAWRLEFAKLPLPPELSRAEFARR